MEIIKKIGLTWLVLILFVTGALLGWIGLYLFELCWPFGTLVLMASVGVVGWCVYSIWEIWTDRL